MCQEDKSLQEKPYRISLVMRMLQACHCHSKRHNCCRSWIYYVGLEVMHFFLQGIVQPWLCLSQTFLKNFSVAIYCTTSALRMHPFDLYPKSITNQVCNEYTNSKHCLSHTYVYMLICPLRFSVHAPVDNTLYTPTHTSSQSQWGVSQHCHIVDPMYQHLRTYIHVYFMQWQMEPHEVLHSYSQTNYIYTYLNHVLRKVFSFTCCFYLVLFLLCPGTHVD